MNNNLYPALRERLRAAYITTSDVAKALGKSKSYVDVRFSGRQEWELEDAYTILCMLDIPPETLPVFFPRGGVGRGKELTDQLSDAEKDLVTAYNEYPEMQTAVNMLLRLDQPKKICRLKGGAYCG